MVVKVLLYLKIFKKQAYVQICVCECSSCRSHKRASDALGLELQVVVRNPTWVLRTERLPIARAASTLIAGPSLQLPAL